MGIRHGYRPMNVVTHTGSHAEKTFRSIAGLPGGIIRFPAQLAGGFSPHPEEDLVFHGGRTIADLNFTNFYIGGQTSWQGTDRKNIDQKLAAAMADPNLNNVIRQYFDNAPIAAAFHASQILDVAPPETFSQGDVEDLVRSLKNNGSLGGVDFRTTLFNFILPRGAVLTTDASPSTQAAARLAIRKRARRINPVHPEDQESSKQGLGGYHGSVHFDDATVYYAIAVFSERTADGANGIPAFDQPWKNVVATLYHEVMEARTDPDVEDAINAGNSPEGAAFLGWVSGSGSECGDFPIAEARRLSDVMKEVPVAGGGTAPIQLQYSNAVHGPEGPIRKPHAVPAQRAFIAPSRAEMAAHRASLRMLRGAER